MRIDIRLSDDHIQRFANMTAAVGEGKARLAIARAINRVVDSVHGKVIRAVVKQTSIPRRIVKLAVQKSKVSVKGDGPLQGVIYASGRPISLKHFGARQFSFGVRAKVWGETRRYASHFINAGRWNSGNPVSRGHVFQRVGKKRLPIEKIDGPSIPEGLIAGEATHAFTSTVETMLPARVSHELGRLLQA
jgi:citrate lyase gamma subunit